MFNVIMDLTLVPEDVLRIIYSFAHPHTYHSLCLVSVRSRELFDAYYVEELKRYFKTYRAMEADQHYLIKDVIQTKEICTEAVKRWGYNLEDIKNQTPEICMLACRCKETLKYVKDQTLEICVKFLEAYDESFQYVRDMTEELCFIALQFNPYTLRYIENQTEEMCYFALVLNHELHALGRGEGMPLNRMIRHNPYIIRYIRNKTPKLRDLSLRLNPYSVVYLDSEEDHLKAVKLDGLAIKEIKNPSPEVYAAAIKQNPEAAKFAKKQH